MKEDLRSSAPHCLQVDEPHNMGRPWMVFDEGVRAYQVALLGSVQYSDQPISVVACLLIDKTPDCLQNHNNRNTIITRTGTAKGTVLVSAQEKSRLIGGNGFRGETHDYVR